MSKQLETEYKNYIQMETPDLWDRIEASLPEREQEPERPVSDTVVTTQIQRKRNRKHTKAILYSGLAAAVLGFVVLPATLGDFGIIKNASESSTSLSTGTTDMADVAGNTMVEEAPVGDAAEEPVAKAEVTEEQAAKAEATEGEAAEEEAVSDMQEAAAEEAVSDMQEAASADIGVAQDIENVEIELTEIILNEDGTMLCSGITEDGKTYNIHVTEQVVFDEGNTENGSYLDKDLLQIGNSYSIDYVQEGEEYRAVAIRKIKKIQNFKKVP